MGLESDGGGGTTAATGLRGRARLIDVAERSGVTKSVVSRIINGDDTLRIRPETRERVLGVAAELGYRPHAGARALSVSRTGAFALIIPDLRNSVYAAITRGAFRRAREHGYVMLFAEDTPSDPAGADEYADLVTSGRVDGLLVASARPGDPLVERLQQEPDSIAHVFVNREVDGSARNIGLDLEGATALAVQFLRDRGHRRIGHTSGPIELAPARAHTAGFARQMSDFGLDASATESGEFTERGGYEATLRLLEHRPELTAVYVSNFGQAVGALKAARDRGRSVPGDLSVIGYDDLAVADYLDPPLTTVAMPLDALGAAAVDALVEQIETRKPVGRRIDGGYHIVERASVARARASADA
ncbi:LacI family transcriptional regulator [Agromyces rhizosphaerae]|uniref:LacI family transcriptional regulator n=1 Tax=Agromyces rhizosphaerae TaxID=88374 RepID=A0A9W6CTN3_9MICO|nr:LacI family DNA-binding transcriptional regulator [Agromyces rhizosphaerae]GLI26629.1 LacI family transcriptional regulator [Agromyces rhizosphaerae]